MQEFNLTYMTSKAHVTLEDRTLHVKIGPFVKKNIELSSIEYFFIKEYKDYKELIIRHTKANGKVTNLRIICSYGIEDIDNLANTLGVHFPAKDLRKIDPKEAMKLMKAVNTQKMALWIVFFLLPAIMTIFFLPGLTHYFDSGHENVKIEDVISEKDFPTHNLTIEGTVLNQGMWEKTTTTSRGSSSTTERNYFPLISENWKEGEPVHVLIETGEMTQAETDEFVYKTSFTGTTRNVLWEGISGDQTDFFQKEYGITFDKNAILFEITDGQPDSYVIWALGLVIFVELIIFFIVWLKYRKSM